MKTKYFLISCLSVAMMFFASCSDSEDNEEPGAGGSNTDVPAMSASDAKQSLQSTANDLLAKIKVSEFEDLKKIFEEVDKFDFEKDNVVANWFEAAKRECLISSKKDYKKYLWQAANFVGEFNLNDNGVWVNTKKGGDKLVFTFKDADGKPCVLTLIASKDGAKIHHSVFDDKEWNWSYENGNYQEYETVTQENRFILPKQTKITLTQNGKTVISVTVNAAVTTGAEVDLSKDAIDVTTEAIVNDYKVVVSKASYRAGKTAEAKATISKGGETLITVSGNAAGNITSNGENSSVNKATISVDILNRAKFVTVIDDVELLNENLERADDCYTDKSRMDKYLANANKLIHADLYLDNSANSSASLFFKSVSDNDYYAQYWTYEWVMKFADDSEYSVDSYFNEKSFKTVVNTVEGIIDDFCSMFGIDEDDNGYYY